MALAADEVQAGAHALSYGSNTLTVLPTEQLDPGYEFPFEELAAYRKGILEALADLLAGFLQYLKDCLCHHFLVDCPECDGHEKLYLACISIRGNDVYNVCNFSLRRYVKSFPTVGYWMSIVPFMPFLRRGLEQLCCMILPELFGRYQAAEFDRSAVGAATAPDVAVARTTVARAQAADLSTRFRFARQQSGAVARAGVTSAIRRVPAAPIRAASLAGLVGQPADVATARLEERGIEVERAPVEALGIGDIVRTLTAIFQAPAPGGHVTLHEDQGVIRMAALTRRPVPADVGAQIEALSRTVRERDEEIDRMRARLGEMEATSAALAEGRVSVERLARLESELRKAIAPAAEREAARAKPRATRRPRRPAKPEGS